MKLAEALAERSDCQVKIDEIKKRLIRSARVQEGEQPAEDTTELLAESGRVFARILELLSAINRTNSKTAFDTELTVSDAIAERDVVGKRRDFLAGIGNCGGRKYTAGSLLDSHAVQCMLRTVTSARRIDYQLLPRAGPTRVRVGQGTLKSNESGRFKAAAY